MIPLNQRNDNGLPRDVGGTLREVRPHQGGGDGGSCVPNGMEMADHGKRNPWFCEKINRVCLRKALEDLVVGLALALIVFSLSHILCNLFL